MAQTPNTLETKAQRELRRAAIALLRKRRYIADGCGNFLLPESLVIRLQNAILALEKQRRHQAKKP